MKVYISGKITGDPNYKQTIEDLIREAFFSGYEKGVCDEKERGN